MADYFKIIVAFNSDLTITELFDLCETETTQLKFPCSILDNGRKHIRDLFNYLKDHGYILLEEIESKGSYPAFYIAKFTIQGQYEVNSLRLNGYVAGFIIRASLKTKVLQTIDY